MGARAALVTGTVLSVAVTWAWALTADLTEGPAAALHLGRNLFSDYAQLADAPGGNGRDLFAVVAGIYTACVLVSRWRGQHRGGA